MDNGMCCMMLSQETLVIEESGSGSGSGANQRGRRLPWD